MDALERYTRRLCEIPDSCRAVFATVEWRERIEGMTALQWHVLLTFARLDPELQDVALGAVREMRHAEN